MTLTSSPTLRLLSEAREALYRYQRLTPSDDRSAGERVAHILEALDDAIAEELRASGPSEAAHAGGT